MPDAGSVYSKSGSFEDLSTANSWTAEVDFGDGSGRKPLQLNSDHSFSLSHTYASKGNYLVLVDLHNDLGATVSTWTRVRVRDSLGSLISLFDYTYDDNGNRKSQTERRHDINSGNPIASSYTYDDLDRLQTVTYADLGTVTYGYDRVGNVERTPTLRVTVV